MKGNSSNPNAPGLPGRFQTAVHRFDEVNAADPNLVWVDGRPVPRELQYALWLTEWVLRLQPQASETLRLAARAQHIARWSIPRSSFPEGRAGYLKWRAQLCEFHAEKAGAILRESGYDLATINAVDSLIRKSGFPEDPESRVLEDALCLVFFERQLPAMTERVAPAKLREVIAKTWRKMTPAAQELTSHLQLPPQARTLMEQALSGSGPIRP